MNDGSSSGFFSQLIAIVWNHNKMILHLVRKGTIWNCQIIRIEFLLLFYAQSYHTICHTLYISTFFCIKNLYWNPTPTLHKFKNYSQVAYKVNKILYLTFFYPNFLHYCSNKLINHLNLNLKSPLPCLMPLHPVLSSL